MSHGAIQKIKVASFLWNTVYLQPKINTLFNDVSTSSLRPFSDLTSGGIVSM